MNNSQRGAAMTKKKGLSEECRKWWKDLALELLQEGDSAKDTFIALAVEAPSDEEYPISRRDLKAVIDEAARVHAESVATDWRKHFEHAGEITAGPPVWLVEDWLLKGTTMALSGLPESYKTFVALNLCKALLTGEPLFGKFTVSEKADVLYLIPEMSRGMFVARKKLMRLDGFGDRFLFQPLERVKRELSDSVVLAACKGRVVLIDTARRYLKGQQAQDAADFSAQCYGLLAAGAVAVVILFHSGKPGRVQKDATLQNSIADSVEHGAQVATGYALKVEDREKGLIRCTNTKNSHRADGHAAPYVLRAKPDLSERGEFGFQPTAGQKDKARGQDITRMLKDGRDTAEIQQALGVSENTVSRYRRKLKKAQ